MNQGAFNWRNEMTKSIKVVKFGSELVVDHQGIAREAIEQYATGLVINSQAEEGLVVVTSGAVAAGKRRLEVSGKSADDGWDKVTLAQLGATSIMNAWEMAFDDVGIYAGGLFATHHEIEDRSEGPSLIRAMKLALSRGVVSIVNENDALSDIELMKLACGGDNDGLASHIAKAIGADVLQLFTKKGGIVDDNGELIEEVNSNNHEQIYSMLRERELSKGAEYTSVGRGGILSKIEAGWSAAQAGIDVRIAATNHDMTGEMVTNIVVG